MVDWQYYSDLGFDPIPLLPGTKGPLCSNWPQRTPADQWAEADHTANIGLRGGGNANLAVIDVDEKNCLGTLVNINVILNDLGFSIKEIPTVQTASGIGRHYYFKMGDYLPGSKKTIFPYIGKGEFYYGSGGYCVCPPSSVDHRPYKLIAGSLENIPEINLEQIQKIINIAQPETIISESEPDVSNLINNRLSRIPNKTWNLLHNIGSEEYSSRSEGDQAIILGLINSERSKEEIQSLLLKFGGAGKYIENISINPYSGKKWFDTSYANALKQSQTDSPGRIEAKYVYEQILKIIFSGRNSKSKRAVMVALASIAIDAGNIRNLGPGIRRLAELSGLSEKTVSNTLHDLCDDGYIIPTNHENNWNASEYDFNLEIICNSITPLYPPLCGGVIDMQNHDLFRHFGLGKGCLIIYAYLFTNPGKTTKEISQHLLIKYSAVNRALNKLMGRNPKTGKLLYDFNTGEIPWFVMKKKGKWYAIERDHEYLDWATKLMNVYGTRKRQHDRHIKERTAYKARYPSKNLMDQENTTFNNVETNY